MASIRKEIVVGASADEVWSALRDVGALHTRLVPGFVVDTVVEDGGAARTVTFANGVVAREVIVAIDDGARRIAWSAAGGRLSHHNASAQALPEGARTRIVWIADLLPDAMAPAVAAMIEQGLAAMTRVFGA